MENSIITKQYFKFYLKVLNQSEPKVIWEEENFFKPTKTYQISYKKLTIQPNVYYCKLFNNRYKIILFQFKDPKDSEANKNIELQIWGTDV